MKLKRLKSIIAHGSYLFLFCFIIFLVSAFGAAVFPGATAEKGLVGCNWDNKTPENSDEFPGVNSAFLRV